MLFSCKITHSVISFLDRRGEDLEPLYDQCDWPSEFLRDPSSWLEADKMESLLTKIQEDYGRVYQGDESFLTAVGHACKDLRAWGVLDSVLRMVQTSKDMFAQPDRFLSYFISPAPPLGEVRRESEAVSFVLPVSEMQFPLVTGYLRAVLEALPGYINKPLATVGWDNSRVTIEWSEHQASLFGEREDTDLSLHPELVRNIFFNLESSQKQLEDLKRELLSKEQQIQQLLIEASAPRLSAEVAGATDADSKLGIALHDLYRLGDYIARGQQLVTLLVGQGRATPQVQEAMRRVDWDLINNESPKVVKRVVTELQGLQEQLRTHTST